MNGRGDAVNDRTISTTRENYEALIEVIDTALLEIHRDKTRLMPETCEGLFIHFKELLREDEIREGVSKNKWVLEQISERNCERHKKLVKLLTRRFELNCSMITSPRAPAAIIKNSEIQEEIDKINVQIDLIIDTFE